MKTWLNVTALAIAALLTQAAFAADCAAPAHCEAKAAGCAADPGCGGCGKTCKLVSTTKKIVVTCYGAKEEQLCIPLPSCKGCTTCENLCSKPGCACSEGCDCRPDCHVRDSEWCPGGAEMYCRKKLVKYEAVKEVPWFKWVVVDCDCNGCEVAHPGNQQPMQAPPAPPKAAVTRPAPAGAKAGMEFEVTDQEMKQIQTQMPATQKPQAAPAPTSSAASPKSTGVARLVDYIR